MEDFFEYIDIFNPVKAKYGEQMKAEIIGITLLQSNEGVAIETVEERITQKGYVKTMIRKHDMNVVMDEIEGEMVRYFDPKDPIEKNVDKFICDLDALSLVMVTDLFHKEARSRIMMRQTLRSIRPDSEDASQV